MDLLAGIALLSLVVASATIVALETVLGRAPAPVVVRNPPSPAGGPTTRGSDRWFPTV